MPDRGTTIDSLMMGQADSGYVFEIRLEAALLPRLKVQVLIVDAKCVGDQLVAGVVVPLHRQLRRHVAGRTNLHPGGCTLEPSPWAVIEFDGGSPNSVDLPDARCEMLKDSTAGSAPKKSLSAANCSPELRSSTYRMTCHGLSGSFARYDPAITTNRSDISMSANAPFTIRHDKTKSQTPTVIPPWFRHGQITSQLHASKYLPDTFHVVACFTSAC